MRPFRYVRATDPDDAARAVSGASSGRAVFSAGGTTLIDLMKLDVLRPDTVVDLAPLRGTLGRIERGPDGLSLGALATLDQIARHADVSDLVPIVPATIAQAGSGQLRNMATLGGNLLQRTRCSYFRDPHAACNKRLPGTGCSALGGDTRALAILGTSSHCIANFPGDLPVALVALDAQVAIRAPGGARRHVLLEEVYRDPGDTPNVETVLDPGDLVEAVSVPTRPWPGWAYVKVRDRAAYAFALASAAVLLRVRDEVVDDVRIVLGGLSTRPWRCRSAETFLRGRALDLSTAIEAGQLCLAGATADAQRAFKVDLGVRTVAKALLEASGRARGDVP